MPKTVKPGITGIEPGQMAVPAMDRPSIAFAWFLDAMLIENRTGEQGIYLCLVCGVCSDDICTIEDGDNLRVLLNTALAHSCQA